MPKLNKNKCFKMPKAEMMTVDASLIPENWLDLLLEQLGIEPQGTVRAQINEHLAGKKQASDYELVPKALRGALQLLYQQIKKTNPSADQIAVFKIKVLEGYPQCTDGFVDRMNACNLSFSTLSWWDERLRELRETLVSDCTIQLRISEVHSVQRVKALAAPYGIFLLHKDRYQGDTSAYSNDLINATLKKIFDSRYQFFGIWDHIYREMVFSLGLLERELKAIELESKTYNQKYNQLTERISELLPEKGINELFLFDEDTYQFQGINWLALKQTVFNILEQDNYVEFTLEERNLLHAVTTQSFSPDVAEQFLRVFIKTNTSELGHFLNSYDTLDPETQLYLIRTHLKSLAANVSSQALIELHGILRTNEQLKDVFAKHPEFLSPLESVDLMELLLDKTTFLTVDNLDSLLSLFSFIPDGLDVVYAARGENNNNLFHVAAQYGTWALKPLANALKKNKKEDLLSNLLRERDSKGKCLSEYLVAFDITNLKVLKELDPQAYSQELQELKTDSKTLDNWLEKDILIEFLEDMSCEKRYRILRDYQKDGNNLLTYIALKKPESFDRLFKLIAHTNGNLAWEMLIKNDSGEKRNSLLMMIRTSHSVDSALEFIKQQDSNRRISILTQPDLWQENSWNVLMYAARYLTPQSPNLLFQLIEQLPEANRMELLKKSNAANYNSLMLSCYYQEDIRSHVLLAQYTPGAAKLVLNQRVVAVTGLEGSQSLHLAAASAHENPFSQLCPLLATLPVEEQALLLNSTDAKGQTPLMYASKNRKDISAVIELMRQWPEPLRRSFVNSSTHRTVFEISIQHQPQVFKQLLEFWKDNGVQDIDIPSDKLLSAIGASPDLLNTLLPRMAKCTSRKEYVEFLKEAVLFTAQHQSWGVEASLYHYIETSLNPEEQIEVLSCQNKKGMNGWLLALQYQPELMEPLYHLITRLPISNQVQILSQKNAMGEDALTLATRYQSNNSSKLVQLLGKSIAEAPGIVVSLYKNYAKTCKSECLADDPFFMALLSFPDELRNLIISMDEFNVLKLYDPEFFVCSLEEQFTIMDALPAKRLVQIMHNIDKVFLDYLNQLDSRAPQWLIFIPELLGSKPLLPRAMLPLVRAWIAQKAPLPLPLNIASFISKTESGNHARDLWDFYELLCDFRKKTDSIATKNPHRLPLQQLSLGLFSALNKYLEAIGPQNEAGSIQPAPEQARSDFAAKCNDAFSQCPSMAINNERGIKKILQVIKQWILRLTGKEDMSPIAMRKKADNLMNHQFFKISPQGEDPSNIGRPDEPSIDINRQR